MFATLILKFNVILFKKSRQLKQWRVLLYHVAQFLELEKSAELGKCG